MNRKLALLFCASICFAQNYEMGAAAGYGFYRNTRVIALAGTLTAGIRDRFAAGATLTEDMYEHLSGELRYLYQDGDPFVSGFGRKANIEGQSHSVTYELLFQVKDREQRLRPYVAAGGGIKYFRATGPEPAPQPFADIVTLTNSNELRWLLSVGGGLKYRVNRRVILRADFRDYINPFPHKLFVAVPGGTSRGLLHQFTPMLGVGYSF